MRRFKLPKIPQTTSKTIRFPNNIVESIEKYILGKECTFTAFVIEAVRIAIEEIKEDMQNKQEDIDDL